jgi:DNA-binding beta-propeller fold protein YncE
MRLGHARLRSGSFPRAALCTAALLSAWSAPVAPPLYTIVDKIKLGGEGGWDYVYVDSGAQRLYVSHANKVVVVDTASDKVVGEIRGTPGVHGIAIAGDAGRGFTSNGGENTVTMFDARSLQVISKIQVNGRDPGAIIYEPVSKRIFAFNVESRDVTSIDPFTGMSIVTIPFEGRPDFAVADGQGRVYVNNQDKNEIYELDAQLNAIARHYPIAPCESPGGLAMDTGKRRLYSVCRNGMIVISDPDQGSVIGTASIGRGARGVVFSGGYAYCANGETGTITVVGETAPGIFGAVSTITTQRGASTIGLDDKTQKLYLPAAEFSPTASGEKGAAPMPSIVPDSFTVLVLAR